MLVQYNMYDALMKQYNVQRQQLSDSKAALIKAKSKIRSLETHLQVSLKKNGNRNPKPPRGDPNLKLGTQKVECPECAALGMEKRYHKGACDPQMRKASYERMQANKCKRNVNVQNTRKQFSKIVIKTIPANSRSIE